LETGNYSYRNNHNRQSQGNTLTIMPSEMTFEDAAAIPQAGNLAIQGLYDKVKIQPGQKVLINGAGGGAGTIAVQLAKLAGVEVTVVDKSQKFDVLRSLGADHVIDFTEENFTNNGKQYDLILDVMAHHSVFAYNRSLKSGGAYAMVGGSVSSILQIAFFGPLISKLKNKKIGIVIHKPNKDNELLKELFVKEKYKPVIDRTFPLSEVPAAFQYFGEGLFKGKIVIVI